MQAFKNKKVDRKTKMTEQPSQKLPEQGHLTPISEKHTPEPPAQADQLATQDVAIEEPTEIAVAPAEQEKADGFFRRRFIALRNAWQNAKQSITTEFLVKKPARLIGEVALIGVYGSIIASKATYNVIGKSVDSFAANIESQERDRRDGYDSFTPKNRIKSKITGKPLKLRPPKPPSVLDSFKSSTRN